MKNSTFDGLASRARLASLQPGAGHRDSCKSKNAYDLAAAGSPTRSVRSIFAFSCRSLSPFASDSRCVACAQPFFVCVDLLQLLQRILALRGQTVLLDGLGIVEAS